jgi:hypothetical protein
MFGLYDKLYTLDDVNDVVDNCQTKCVIIYGI